MHTEKMDNCLKTEDDYREALKRFVEILESDEGTYDACELFQLMRKLETYEQENCEKPSGNLK